MRQLRRWVVGGAVCVLSACTQVAEQPEVSAQRSALAPANDRCTSPTPVPPNTVVAGTTVEGTNDSWGCGFAYLPGPDVFFSFDPGTSSPWRATVTSAGGLGDGGCADAGCLPPSHVLYLFEPDCDAGLCRTLRPDSTLTFRSTSGVATTLVVDSSSTQGGPFDLVVSSFVPASNDTCANPAVLTLGTTVVDFTNALDDDLGGTDAGFGCGYPGAPDLAFAFTPATSGRFRFSLPAGVLTIGSGTCGGTCSSYASTIELDLVAGTTSYVIADGFGVLLLRVDPVVVPPNDRCTSAQPLSLGVPFTGTTVGAGPDVFCSWSGGNESSTASRLPLRGPSP